MTSSRLNLAVGGAAILLCALVLANTAGSQAQEPEGNYGVGIPDVFIPKYLAYRYAAIMPFGSMTNFLAAPLSKSW